MNKNILCFQHRGRIHVSQYRVMSGDSFSGQLDTV